MKGRFSTSVDQPVSPKVPPGTYALIGEDYLADPKATGRELDFSDARVSLCKWAVDAVEPKPEDLASLEACARLEYAAVIRKGTYLPPKAGDAVYTPGELRGDLLVFHLKSGELRGSYTLAAKNEQQVKTKGKVEKYEVEKLAAKELEAKVKSIAVEKLK